MKAEDPCDITPEFLRRMSAFLGPAADDYARRINEASTLAEGRSFLLEALHLGYRQVSPKLKIATQKRTADWTATIPELSGAWEAGKSEAEAIGNLMITLHCCWPERGISIQRGTER